jgi:hypothetical protein
MPNAFDEFDTPNAFDEFDSPIVAPVAVPARKLSLAEQTAMREAQARNARVMRIIPGTGFLSPEKGLRSNQQSQALLQGLSFNTSDEIASALAAARTGISNLRGRGPGFSAREAYDARMRQEREQMGQFQAERPNESMFLNVAGALANPLTRRNAGYIAAGKTVPQVMGRAALVGGVQGAAAGAGAGNDLESRIKGAIGGGVAGGAATGLVSGVGQKLAQGLAGRAVRRAQPTFDALEKKASDLYLQADQAGLIIKSSSINKFANNLVTDITSKGLRRRLHANAMGALNELKSIKSDMSLKEAELTRRVIKDYVQSSKNKSDKRMGYLILDKFDDFVDNLLPTDTVAGSNARPAVDLLNKARGVYKVNAKGETIEDLITKAKNNTGPLGIKLEQNIISEFKKLANTRGISRFSEEEQKAIRNVANGSVTRNVISTLGKLAPSFSLVGLSGLASAAYGNFGPLIGGAITAGMVGIPSKIAATKATVNAARLAAALAKGAKAPVASARPAATAGTIAGAYVAPRTRSK